MIAPHAIEALNNLRTIRQAFWNALRPPPSMTVDEHAERTLYLSERTSAIHGLIDFGHTPYLRGPLRMFSDPRVVHLFACFGTQTGKTTLEMAIFNFIVDYSPGPLMLVYPTQHVAKEVSKDRWQRLFDDCESLRCHRTSKADDFQLLQYTLDRMTVRFAWNSMASVSSHPERYILKDETKDLEAEINAAVDDRAKNFFGRKIIEASSPLHPKDNMWTGLGLARDHAEEDKYQTADKGAAPGLRLPVRRWKPASSTSVHFFHVPCPLCGHCQPMHPDRIRWPRDCAIRDITWKATYLCEKCDKEIPQHAKRAMVEAGEWVSPNPGGVAIGFHLSSLYSLLGESCTWGEIAARYIRVHKYTEPYKAFVNGYLAWPWEEEEYGRDSVSVAVLKEMAQRQGGYRRNTLPDGALIVTAGFDVRKTEIHYVVWGWGGASAAEREAWLIAWDIHKVDMEANPDEAMRWISELRPLPFVGGDRKLMIVAAGIDTGYKAEDVYGWCRQLRWLWPMKGRRGDIRVPEGMEEYVLTATRVDKTPSGRALPGGIVLRSVNTGLIKRELYDALSSGSARVPVDADQIILGQLNSEKIVTRRNARTGRLESYFVQKRKAEEEDAETAQNHFLDATMNARAALEVLVAGQSIETAARRWNALVGGRTVTLQELADKAQ
jgi:phage terminase large subunit GpA-like protein